MLGKKFGKWTVTNSSEERDKGGGVMWECSCECGHEAVLNGSKLRGGKTKSCRTCANVVAGKRSQYLLCEGRDLYMVRVKGTGIVKIGSSGDVAKRLKNLQRSNHEELELVGHWPKEGGREEAWHKELAHLRVRGEWFDLGSSCEL